jgi:hypothetical protein
MMQMMQMRRIQEMAASSDEVLGSRPKPTNKAKQKRKQEKASRKANRPKSKKKKR